MTATQHASRSVRRPRPGFTLIEILIVLAIIGILGALTAGAVMQVLTRQRSSNTETTIKSAYSILDKQWTAVVDDANKEQVPASVLNLAGGDTHRARVFWIKLRLKQEFPQTFMEMLAPWAIQGITAAASPVPLADLPPRPSYVQALAKMNVDTVTLTGLAVTGKPFPATQLCESSVCLLIALQQGRKGITFDQERLGANALADGPYQNPNGGTVMVKQVVDAWTGPSNANDPLLAQQIAIHPLLFFRYPWGSAELNATNPAKAGGQTKFRDPLDPQGQLENPTWNNRSNWNARAGVWVFEQLCHPLHSPTGIPPLTPPGAGYPAASRPASAYMVPVLLSTGRNGLHGLDPVDMQTLSPDANDNIYSYVLRLGAHGD